MINFSRVCVTSSFGHEIRNLLITHDPEVNCLTVLFISKSFGTIIAGEAAREFKHLNIRNLFLTPVGHTVPYINETDCTVIYGSADPYFLQSDVDKISDSRKLIALPGADHSLEVGADYRASLGYLARVCEVAEAFLK